MKMAVSASDVIYSPERVQGPFFKQPAAQVSCGWRTWKHTAAISGNLIKILEAQRGHPKCGANFAMLSPLTIWPVKDIAASVIHHV
ncbi:uncharacterized protein [Primulina eburnea]|uniref:uncharacterized protein isoform X2 n=1 Tax=Primulina eburnea TaxID=1245227 RepID=UPI003C6C4F88